MLGVSSLDRFSFGIACITAFRFFVGTSGSASDPAARVLFPRPTDDTLAERLNDIL